MNIYFLINNILNNLERWCQIFSNFFLIYKKNCCGLNYLIAYRKFALKFNENDKNNYAKWFNYDQWLECGKKAKIIK